ncbi:MAG: DUF4416 family protein [Sedimentisphaerales bacterium]|nr:DUF4416 family protein [Sedimentisphaerales bacterium]
MWQLREPNPVKVIVGVLASDNRGLDGAVRLLASHLGAADLVSDVWPFDQTAYYHDQMGPRLLRQFVAMERLVDPGALADLKLQTNELEMELARSLDGPFPRPVNLDPGLIEPSKLILASTKNYAHRIYIGQKIYAEVTLVFDKGAWRPLPYTYPDYRQQTYFDFFNRVRDKLLQQRRSMAHEK